MSEPDLGASTACRREVYDVLAAAGGSLPYTELRDRVAPRLRKQLLKAITEVGDIDTYLDDRLKHFTGPDGLQKEMLLYDGSDVSLLPRYRLKHTLPNGKVSTYRPGMQHALDRADQLKNSLLYLRRLERGAWDGLPSSPGREASRALESSLAAVGWMDGQSATVDATGFVIDGRKRLEIANKLGGRIEPKRTALNKRGVPPLHGIVQSFHLNRARMSKAEVDAYHAEVKSRLGVTWTELERLYALTYEWVTTSPAGAVNPASVTLDNGEKIHVSRDWEWVQIRDTLKIARIPVYDAKRVKETFVELGLDINQSVKSGSQAAVWVRRTDIPTFIAKAPDIWPRVPERTKKYLDFLAELVEELDRRNRRRRGSES